MSKDKKNLSISIIISNMKFIFKQYPILFVPFIFILLFDFTILFIIFLSPKYPFSILIAPIIKAFIGEQFLHYPANFLVLPKLFDFTKNVFSFIIGIGITGIAANLIYQANENSKPSLWFGLKKTLTKYFRLLIIWTITFLSILCVIFLCKLLDPVINSNEFSYLLQFLSGNIMQMLFVFAIPSVIIENKKVFFAIVRSFVLCKKYFLYVLFLILFPVTIILPFIFLETKIPFFIEKAFPEATLYLIIGKIIATTLVDFIITASAVIVLLKHREIEKEA